MSGTRARSRLARFVIAAAAGLLLVAGACQKPAVPDDDEEAQAGDDRSAAGLPASLYQDVTAAAGIHSTYRNGEQAGHYAILESLGGGVALIDYDGDGLLDVFLPGGGYYDGPEKKQIKGHPARLYRNLGNWKFKDVTREAGLDQPLCYSHGAAVVDYDRDGWPDLLVTGYGRLALYHNEPVDPADPKKGRRFREVTKEAGLLSGDHFWSTSAAFADLDGDGWPDLYVCQYVNWSFTNNPKCEGYSPSIPRDVCPPRQFEAVAHALYRNVPGPDGTRRFVDVSKEAGLRVPRVEEDYAQLDYLDQAARDRLRTADKAKDYGKGLGVVIVDVNGDGKPDIYVANDTTDNLLYLNRSRPGQLRFEENALDLGVARDGGGTATGSMGVDAADYDGRGLPALWVTTYEGEFHSLYRRVPRQGQQFFLYASMVAKVAALGQQYVGFGTGFVDVDNDGWQDLVISNGHVIHHPVRSGRRQRPVLMRNLGDGTFANITDRGGPYFRTDHVGRGLAIGDLDNDGRPDLVISHVNEPAAVLRHTAAPANHWLGVELVGADHRDVVGARLTLEVNGRRLTRFARSGGSYLSSGDRRHLFGLGPAGRPGRLTVDWPSGEPRTQHWDGLEADRYWRLAQGVKRPQSRGGPAKP